jgi:hypothetical protein
MRLTGRAHEPFGYPLTHLQRLECVHEDYQAKVEITMKEALERQQDAQIDFVFSNGNWVKGHVRWWPFGLVGASKLPTEGGYVVLIL